jgi:hypothetical protein
MNVPPFTVGVIIPGRRADIPASDRAALLNQLKDLTAQPFQATVHRGIMPTIVLGGNHSIG